MTNNEIIEVLTELLNSIPTKMLKATITFSVKNMEGEYSAEVKADNLNELLIELGNARNRNTGDRNTGHCNTGNCNTGDCNTGHCNTGRWNAGDCNTGDRNTGDCNTGRCNAGDCNTGDRNTGDCNTGRCNTGDRNTGRCNTGDCNTGRWNAGNRNTGHCNTGDCNTGDCNAGDFNISDFNTGCFNTETHPLYFFDKFANVDYYQWATSKAHDLLYNIQLTEWVSTDKMTEEEKKEHPDYEIMGGYLKSHTLKEACDLWWNKLSENEKEIIKTIPNFNPDKFYEITGIRVEE